MLKIDLCFEDFNDIKTLNYVWSVTISLACFPLKWLRCVISCRLYLEQNDFHEKFSGSNVILDRSSESVTCQTFELTLRSCLYPHIERRYIECCGNLMRTLKKDYRWDWIFCAVLLCSTFILNPLIFYLRLLGYLQAMRNYFLLEAGDTMYDFYTAIFDKVLEKESWQQLAFLNVQLQEAVGQRHPEDSSRYCTLISSDPVVYQINPAWYHSVSCGCLHIFLMIPGCLYFLKLLTLQEKNSQWITLMVSRWVIRLHNIFCSLWFEDRNTIFKLCIL